MEKHKEFWLGAKSKIEAFKKLDDGDVVFGANTRGWGHKYKTFPTMSEAEILKLERKKQISLPNEFRSYLLHFGAGGAGPDYGVEDLRKTFNKTEFEKSFVYTEASKETGDICDNEPIEDFSGLLYLGTAGCCTDYFIELLGNEVGKIWCNWGDGGCNSEGSLVDFYSKWLSKTEVELDRYTKLKKLKEKHEGAFGKFKKLNFEEVTSQMSCKYKESEHDGSKYGLVPKGQVWIYFENTQGKVILNESREILRIEVGN